jgi:molybdopterin-guanine dinucleotide biosynthesis protein A
MRSVVAEAAICLLAGGEAQRLPGKLEMDVGGMPLVLRVYRELRGFAPLYVSVKGGFPPPIDAAIDAPMVLDRWPGRGPLGGILSVAAVAERPLLFVVAADAPFVKRQTLESLAEAWEDGTEAVVPIRGSSIQKNYVEPLCALYDRAALLREGYVVLREGSGAVRAVVERLKARRVRIGDERVFLTMNTPADRHAIHEER